MSLQSVFARLRYILIVIAILSTTYLYLYPVFFGCAFPSTAGSTYDGFKNTIALHRSQIQHNDPSVAPFRLLVLADPQLEGDSSLPDPEDALLARLRVHTQTLLNSPPRNLSSAILSSCKELVLEDIPRSFQAVRKTLDLFGNDYYLAHIYRTLHWWSVPTHVTVLGDLIGSQWVNDAEFEWRGWRYWHRTLDGSRKVDESMMAMHEQETERQVAIPLESQPHDWSKQIINIVGNHDIGYAGDISPDRIARFERIFGKVNWDIHFSYPKDRTPSIYSSADLEIPSIHLIVLNSMILDTPALHGSVQSETYNYINGLISSRLCQVEKRNNTFTLLLTHVPLHKPEGVCVDAPFFDFWDYDDEDGLFKNGGLKEQNHLSEHTSHQGILQGIYGMSGNLDASAGGKGRQGLILTGHDHEGCDTVHYIERTHRQPSLVAIPTAQIPDFDLVSEDNAEDGATTEVPDSPQEPDVTWEWRSVHTSQFNKMGRTKLDFEGNVVGETEIVTALREITLRSMMGEYSGNAALLSLWFDFTQGTWDYAIHTCPLGVQHIWWAIHVLDLVTILLLLAQWLVFTRFRHTPNKHQRARKANNRITHKSIDSLLKTPSQTSGKEVQSRSSSQRRRKG